MIGTLTMHDLARIRRMSVADAIAYISGHMLTQDEKAAVLKLAGKNLIQTEAPPTLPRGQVHDASRPMWFLVAWLMGASWRQLAFLHKVTHQTVMASADKIMISHMRQKARLATTMSYEKLSAYHAAFVNSDWTDMEPVAIAERLLSTTDTDT